MASGNSREGASAGHPAPNFKTGMPSFFALAAENDNF
jgi:hypothetical protein